VACTLMNKNEVSIFDIGYEASEPTVVFSFSSDTNEIHSININPSCPYELGFHLDDDSAVAVALAFRTFVMICWVEERIVGSSIEGSVVHIQGVTTIIIRPSGAISSCGLEDDP
ncbi:hypothetical protein Tco_1478922, partial [Tanacetum coccineum]